MQSADSTMGCARQGVEMRAAPQRFPKAELPQLEQSVLVRLCNPEFEDVTASACGGAHILHERLPNMATLRLRGTHAPRSGLLRITPLHSVLSRELLRPL